MILSKEGKLKIILFIEVFRVLNAGILKAENDKKVIVVTILSSERPNFLEKNIIKNIIIKVIISKINLGRICHRQK